MQKTEMLLGKLLSLAKNGDRCTVLDLDLMLDYTRLLYADLLDQRAERAAEPAMPQSVKNEPPVAPVPKELILPANEATATNEQTNTPQRTPFTPPRLQRYSDSEVPKQYFPLKPDPEAKKGPQTGSLKSVISINDKYQFISELFGNNKDAYNEVIAELERFETYDQATTWLNSKVYNQYGWEEDSETAQSFYFVLSQYFASV